MELEDFKNQQFAGVAALVEAAMRAMSGVDSRQEKGTVTALPDERTVRYYISEGLLPIASEKRGTSTLFGYVHLLALLTIKKLQAENLPIKKIRDIIEGKSERELEVLLGTGGPVEGKNDAQTYLESLLISKPSHTYTTPSMPRAASTEPPMFSASIEEPTLFSAPLSAPAPTDLSDAPSPAAARSSAPASWSRIEIEPGVEMHVSQDYKPPEDEGDVKKILSAIEKAIRSFINK